MCMSSIKVAVIINALQYRLYLSERTPRKNDCSSSRPVRFMCFRSLQTKQLRNYSPTGDLWFLFKKWVYFIGIRSIYTRSSWCWHYAPFAPVMRSTWMWGFQSSKREKRLAVYSDFLLHCTSSSLESRDTCKYEFLLLVNKKKGINKKCPPVASCIS